MEIAVSLFAPMMVTLMLAGAGSGTGEPDPDGVVVTAPQALVVLEVQPTTLPEPPGVAQDADRAAHGLTTDQQINRWLSQRSGQIEPWIDAGIATEDSDRELAERRVHGEVFGSIGTGGYRAWGGSVVVPVGEEGLLSLSIVQGQNDRWGFGPGYGWDNPMLGGRTGHAPIVARSIASGPERVQPRPDLR